MKTSPDKLNQFSSTSDRIFTTLATLGKLREFTDKENQAIADSLAKSDEDRAESNRKAGQSRIDAEKLSPLRVK